jgi:hypothetical protein
LIGRPVSDTRNEPKSDQSAGLRPGERGNSGTAIAGSVASAIRFLIKTIMLGHVSGIPETSEKGLQILQGTGVFPAIKTHEHAGRFQAFEKAGE